MTGSPAESDWQFMLALAVTAFLIAGVVLVYMVVSYRRARALERQLSQEIEPSIATVMARREPIYFKRYVPEE